MLRDHGAIVQCYAPMEAALVELDEAISSTAIDWRFWLVDDAVVGDGGEYFLLLRGGGSQ